MKNLLKRKVRSKNKVR